MAYDSFSILSLHNTNIETTAKDNPDGVPTPRAISERLGKIRNDAKGKGAKFSISKGKGTGSAQSTPLKGSQKSTPKTPTSKRKRGSQEDHEMKVEDVLETPSAKRILVKPEPEDDKDGIMDAEAFTPRVKREISVPTPRLGVVPFYGFANEANAPEANTSGSEFSLGDADDDDYEDANMA